MYTTMRVKHTEMRKTNLKIIVSGPFGSNEKRVITFVHAYIMILMYVCIRVRGK